MNIDKKQNNQGTVAIIVIAVALVIGIAIIAFIALRGDGLKPLAEIPLLPPASERTNPDPTSGNSITVGEVDPGTVVTISEVTLTQDGYLAVQREAGEQRITLGKSELLTAGTHTNVSVTSSEPLYDGNAIYIAMQDGFGQMVVDENENYIEVLKNVGMLSGHQTNDQLPEEQSYY